MGFETIDDIESVSNNIIWTLSLWDLKLEKNTNNYKQYYLNFVPMGFETNCSNINIIVRIWFELCPYGIWNSVSLKVACAEEVIWTLSLWDLKLRSGNINKGRTLDLNFVPMGFETSLLHPSRCQPLIWTLSLWDLKR